MTKIVTIDEVQQAVANGTAILVEALPREHYDKEHLPGARATFPTTKSTSWRRPSCRTRTRP